MATATPILVLALRETARRLEAQTTPYRWAHFGQCNCGHLAQTLTGLASETLQRSAEQQRGDWSEQAIFHEREVAASAAPLLPPDYGDRLALDEGAWEPEAIESCAVTDIPMTTVLARLTAVGLTAEDLVHLERLSDPNVRRMLGTNTREFHYASRENLVAYLDAWALLLERAQPSPTPLRLDSSQSTGGAEERAAATSYPTAAE